MTDKKAVWEAAGWICARRRLEALRSPEGVFAVENLDQRRKRGAQKFLLGSPLVNACKRRAEHKALDSSHTMKQAARRV